jgi:hypothetical protein
MVLDLFFLEGSLAKNLDLWQVILVKIKERRSTKQE